MKNFLIAIFITLFSYNASAQKTQQVLPFQNHEAKQRLLASTYNNDFFQLVNFYQPQINPLYCGIATSVIVLNALNHNHIQSQKQAEVQRPEEFGGGIIEFRSYLQSSFLNEKTNKVKDKGVIELSSKDKYGSYDPGLTLGNLKDILVKSHGLKVEKIHAKKDDKESLEKFRKALEAYLSDDKHFIIVNFNGKLIGNKTGGHISPLAAYHEPTDSVLVMDVALHKNPWYFVKVKDLYKAMNSKDGRSYRGYLIVSK